MTTRQFWLAVHRYTGLVALVFVGIQFHPLQTVSLAVTKQQRQFHAQLARLDAGLHRLMLNTDGMGYLLTEPN